MPESTPIQIIARVGDRAAEALALFTDHSRVRDPIPLPAEPPLTPGTIIAFTWHPGTEVDGLETLAAPDTARAELYALLSRLRINPLYPPEVMAEVADLLEHPAIDDPELIDLSDLPFVTIDNEDSRDLDQALHIERSGSGFVVRYALADAAYYVRPGGPLFAEALARGASYYLPGFSVPMLPPALSEGLVSLNPNVPRRALVFTLTLAENGRLLRTDLSRARIRSRAKLSYDGVQDLFDRSGEQPLSGEVFSESLGLLREVGERRIELARQRDIIPFDRTEVEVVLADPTGERFAFHREARNDVSHWNEKISLLCNIAGARLMTPGDDPDPEVQAVFRVHVAPSAERLAELRETIAAIVAHHRLDEQVWGWRTAQPHETVADYLGRLPRDTSSLAIRASLERQILISNRRSTFSPEPGLHFALGVAPYSRFSAPMREIVGIFTHKEAAEKVGLEQPQQSATADEKLRDEVIEAANRAKQQQGRLTGGIKQRAVSRLLARDLDQPLADRPIYTGLILGVRATRLYVRLEDPPIELKVYTDRLEEYLGCELIFHAGDVALRDRDGNARFAIGDGIRLRTHSAQPDGHRWYLVPDADVASVE